MFKRILIAVDGSIEARAAALQGIELAHALGGAVVAVHVAPPFQTEYFEDFVPPPETTREMWQASMRNVAERNFQPLRAATQVFSVPLDTDVVFDNHPADAIIATAKHHVCDLIVMGPRGRGGVTSYLLGSVTTRVLGASRVPVLVHRSAAEPGNRALE